MAEDNLNPHINSPDTGKSDKDSEASNSNIRAWKHVSIFIALAAAILTLIAAMIIHNPLVLVLVLLFVLVLLEGLALGGFGVVLGQQQLRGYGAALIATARFLPGAAALATVVIYLTPWSGSIGGTNAPFWGSGIALVAWMTVAIFCLRFTDAQYAIPSSYGELRQRLDLLKSQLSVLCTENTRHNVPCKIMACKQAHAQIEMIEEEFNQRGLSWALARGYINVWNRLHRAEEAMIEVAPQEVVIAGALNDVLRLQGSNIDHDEALIYRLRQAIDVIEPDALRYLKGPLANNPPDRPPAVTAAANLGAGAPGGNTSQQAQARAVLRDVRCAINEFRDGRWNGLIVARNRLIATMIFTGMTAYMLLSIAIILGVQRPAIAAASTYYLVGATIGLLNQLRSASQNDTAVEDYGLSAARLITMPLLCGLAAIGGVVLMAMPQMGNSSSSNTAPLAITTPSNLPKGVSEQLYHQRIDATGGTPPYSWLSINGPMPEGMKLEATGDLIANVPKKTDSTTPVKFTAQVKDSTESSVSKPFFMDITSPAKESAVKQPSPQILAGSAPNLARSLEDIFDLHNMINLLLAAVFGLTPGLLFDRLQQQSEKYKDDLKGSEASQVNRQPQK